MFVCLRKRVCRSIGRWRDTPSELVYHCWVRSRASSRASAIDDGADDRPEELLYIVLISLVV